MVDLTNFFSVRVNFSFSTECTVRFRNQKLTYIHTYTLKIFRQSSKYDKRKYYLMEFMNVKFGIVRSMIFDKMLHSRNFCWIEWIYVFNSSSRKFSDRTYLVSHMVSYSVLHSTGPGTLQSLTKGVWHICTVSSTVLFLYSIKQSFWKDSSHSSSCVASKSVV